MSNEFPGGVYCIHNTRNHKRYFGQSGDPTGRMHGHLLALLRGNHGNVHLQGSFNKHGREAFKFILWRENLPDGVMDRQERYWIKRYETCNPQYGYNSESGGCKNKHLSAEHCTKIGASNKGKIRTVEVCAKMSVDRTGKKNSFYDKHHTEENIQKQKKRMNGRYVGEKNPNFGNHILKGRKRPEHSEWMKKNNPFKDKRHKEESINQMKASIRRGFENGRVGPQTGKDYSDRHNKETCRCCSCMSRRGQSYGRNRLKETL